MKSWKLEIHLQNSEFHHFIVMDIWLESFSTVVTFNDAKDIVNLDCALNNRALRSKYIAAPGKCFPSVTIKNSSSLQTILEWKITRNYSIKELIVECDVETVQSISWKGFEEIQALTMKWSFSLDNYNQHRKCILNIPMMIYKF